MKLKSRWICCILILLLLCPGIAASEKSAKSAKEASDVGYRYGSEKNYKAAIEAYTRAIQLDPKYADAYYGRGSAYWYTGNYEIALKDLNRAIELNQEYWKYYWMRGYIHKSLEDYDKAISDYSKARIGQRQSMRRLRRS